MSEEGVVERRRGIRAGRTKSQAGGGEESDITRAGQTC